MVFAAILCFILLLAPQFGSAQQLQDQDGAAQRSRVPVGAKIPVLGTRRFGSPHEASPQTLNNVLYANRFQGVDIGDQVNRAYASCPSSGSATGCRIVVPPGIHTYSTPINLTPGPSAEAVLLDCTPGISGNAEWPKTGIVVINRRSKRPITVAQQNRQRVRGCS